MTTRFTFVPAQVLGTHSGPLGTPDPIWPTTDPMRPPGPGLWEEVVTGPDAEGRYTVEFRPRAPESRVERERRVAVYIMKHGHPDPDAVSVRSVSEATNIPRATVGKLAAWKEFASWRKASRVSEARTRSLTDAMLACIAGKADDPAEMAQENELAALIADQERDGVEEYYRPVRETGRDG
jgi:hypothetical protein